MVSTRSKAIIFILLSLLTAYIIIVYSPFEGYDVFNKKNSEMEAPALQKLLVKKTMPESATSAAAETNTAAVETKESPHLPVTPTTPKVSETKQGVYEVLETSHSDTDETYRPKLSPCTSPMGYRIGTFDSKFGLSKEKFLAITRDAASTWEHAAGTSLFTYDPSGPLTINLVYDERQATTIDLGYRALEIENSKETAENIRKVYEQQKASYASDSEAFNQDATLFQSRYTAYNEKVKGYNDKGGATQTEYDAMMRELDVLKTDSAQFETRRADLLKRMDTINASVKRYNELVAYINTLIRKSNAIGTRTFTEGKFTPSSNTIDIYQYSDETKLRRVLTHELGHAIGIGHVKNVQSVMYAFNSGTSTSLSGEDRQALATMCPSR